MIALHLIIRMRVANIQVVAGFERDDEILLSAGKYLQKLSRELGVSMPKMSVPGSAPPEAPRAIIPGSTTLIQVGLNRAELFAPPPDHIAGNFESAADFGLQAANRFLLELMTVVRYAWVGAVSTINFPAKAIETLMKAATPVSDRLVNVPRKDRELSHLNLQIGFKEDPFHVTYSISGYEIRTGTISRPATRSIDVSTVPVTETGIEIRLDINNKPQEAKRGLKTDLPGVFEMKKARFRTLKDDLNLEGIL